jgi:hypothetical protein
MATYACRSFRSTAWSSLQSPALAKLVSRRVDGVRLIYGGAGGKDEVDALEQGCWSSWWVCRYPPLRRWDAVDLGPR